MRMPIPVRYPDYDTKGHVNNAVYLTYFEMARSAAWLDVIGGDADFPFILAEARVRYVSEAMIGESLEIEISTTEIRTRAWVWGYAIRAGTDGRTVAEGQTVQVMFDYAEKRTIPIPDALRERLAAV